MISYLPLTLNSKKQLGILNLFTVCFVVTIIFGFMSDIMGDILDFVLSAFLSF